MYNSSAYLNIAKILPNLGELVKIQTTNRYKNIGPSSVIDFYKQGNAVWDQQSALNDITPLTPVENVLYMIGQQLQQMTAEMNKPEPDEEFLKHKYLNVVKLHQKATRLKILNKPEHTLSAILDRHKLIKAYAEKNISLPENYFFCGKVTQ